MTDSKNISLEINDIITSLINCGLADRFNYPKTVNNETQTIISFKNDHNASRSLKNIPYEDIYDHLLTSNCYNILLPDGGLLLYQYTYDTDGLHSHRLCFFPCPSLELFQNSSEIYINEEIYGDVVNKNIVVFPIRFDYKRDEVESEMHHPKSHGTFGQYKNCRIPVTGPLSPKVFTEFILNNFYAIPTLKFEMKSSKQYCENHIKTLTEEDIKQLHLNI